jgi:hypothetical protein
MDFAGLDRLCAAAAAVETQDLKDLPEVGEGIPHHRQTRFGKFRRTAPKATGITKVF